MSIEVWMLLPPCNKLLHCWCFFQSLKCAVAVSQLCLSVCSMDCIMALPADVEMVRRVVFDLLVLVLAPSLRHQVVQRKLSLDSTQCTSFCHYLHPFLSQEKAHEMLVQAATMMNTGNSNTLHIPCNVAVAMLLAMFLSFMYS